MSFTQSLRSFFKNWKTFSGRSSRSEYWYPILVYVVIAFCLGYFGEMSRQSGNPWDYKTITLILQIVWFLPTLSVSVRRLHDINKSGFAVLLPITIIGLIPYTYWLCKKGDEGDNSYGPNPKLGGKDSQLTQSAITENPPIDIYEGLEKLGKLRDSGILTDDEFKKEKERLLKFQR